MGDGPVEEPRAVVALLGRVSEPMLGQRKGWKTPCDTKSRLHNGQVALANDAGVWDYGGSLRTGFATRFST